MGTAESAKLPTNPSPFPTDAFKAPILSEIIEQKRLDPGGSSRQTAGAD
jgi:hypothetical protein